MGWCHYHTSRNIPRWIYIQYTPAQSLYSSRKQSMWPHDPQYCPSTQARVTVAWICKSLVFRWWLKWAGAVAIPQGTCHGEMTSNIHLHKACIAPGSNLYGHMTLSIVHPLKQRVTVAWVCKNMVFIWWLKWCGAVVIPQGTCHGALTSNIHLHKACAAPGSNRCGRMTLSIIHPLKQGSL